MEESKDKLEDFLKDWKQNTQSPIRINGIFLSCTNSTIECDKDYMIHMGKMKEKHQTPPKSILMCLNCSFIEELERIHQKNLQNYQIQYRRIDENYYNQRTLRKKEMKKIEYFKRFNEDMDLFLTKLKQNHKKEFSCVQDECLKQKWW